MKKIKEYIEKNKIIKSIEIVVLLLLFLTSIFLSTFSFVKINSNTPDYVINEKITLTRDISFEDYDDTYKYCDVYFVNGEYSIIVSCPYDQYIDLPISSTIEASIVSCNDNTILLISNEVNDYEVAKAYKEKMIEKYKNTLSISLSLFVLSISILIIFLFSKCFTCYEKIWFISIMLISTIFSIFFPEESANGISGIAIMLLYLLDILLNILCELLISKQSKWNFIVSIGVEITEILMCIVFMYRFSTMATTLLFWLPIDIVSFINWNKHKDEENEELTVVRSLKGYQELLIMLAIIVWTIIVGYLLSGINIDSFLFNGNKTLATIVIYLDACASAIGIANGLFIFFRLKEQWIAWYICAFLEMLINILAGQYILIILKIGYFTNTTYGLIKWSKYIKKHDKRKEISN